MVTFNISKLYNLNTIAPVTLGERYENIKVIAIGDFHFAKKYADIPMVHKAVENEVSVALPEYTDVPYIIFKNEDNKEIVLADSWIMKDSVIEINKINAVVTINDINTSDLKLIQQQLNAIGFNNIKIEKSIVS